jgi:acyl-CoA reductase-like NAD-dependent aldehyde dehydrogenase
MTLWTEAPTHLLHGEPWTGKSSELLDVVEPATEEVIAGIPVAGAEDVDRAVEDAAGAQPGWAALGADGRAEVVAAAVASATPAADELAELQCREMGQPWSIARPLVDAVLGGLSAAMEAARAYPFATRLVGDDKAGTDVLRLPRGVGGLITPWNFPLPVAMGGLAGLLAGGNTVVWKPSELSPLSAVRLAELLDLPAGVLNVVLGDGRTGAHLAAHPRIAMVVFTGSVEAGRSVARACAERFVPALLELGGKDPVVVDDDVDIAWAAGVVAYGGLWNSGQVCTSMERVYVHRSVADDFVDALVTAAQSKVVGVPMDPATELGPLVSAHQRQAVVQHVDDAVARGAQVLTGGSQPAERGFYFPPTVLLGVGEGMLAHDVETFGPTIGVQVVDSFADGLSRAARSDYGLCATLLTNRPEHALRGSEIPAAMCWVNEWQGGAPGAVYEPARLSGLGAVGTLDTFTRPMTLHRGLGR